MGMSVATSIRTAVFAVMVAISAAGASGLHATVAGSASNPATSHPAGQVLAAEYTPSDTPWGPGSTTP